jgi:hypothetical protein
MIVPKLRSVAPFSNLPTGVILKVRRRLGLEIADTEIAKPVDYTR